MRRVVSSAWYIDGEEVKLSLHAQGCIAVAGYSGAIRAVVPACAGLYRNAKTCQQVRKGCPCMRRVVSFCCRSSGLQVVLSLHAQGCIYCRSSHDQLHYVVPACAGLYRHTRTPVTRSWRCPCMRRVVSGPQNGVSRPHVLSLHAQGCILSRVLQERIYGVVPACAGLYRYGTVPIRTD